MGEHEPGRTQPGWVARAASITTSVVGREVVQVEIDAGSDVAIEVRWIGSVEVRVDSAGQPVAARCTVRGGQVPVGLEAAFGPMVGEAIRTMSAPVGFGPWRKARPRFRAGVPLGAPEPPFLPGATIRIDVGQDVIELARLRSGSWWAVTWHRDSSGLSQPSAVPLENPESVKVWLVERGLSDYADRVG